MPLADYGFTYSDEEETEQDVDIENEYYNSKGACGAAHGLPAPAHAAGRSRGGDRAADPRACRHGGGPA